MNFSSWLKGTVAATVVMLVIAGLGYSSVSRLKEQAKLIVEDTIPGLSNAGAANANLAAAHNRTLLFLWDVNPSERARYRHEIDSLTAVTTGLLSDYEAHIFSNEDRKLYAEMIVARTNYLTLRNQLLMVAQNGNQEQALQFLKTKLLAAYENYKVAGETVLNFNIRQGKARGEAIMASSFQTQLFVATVALVLFILGFLFGLFR